MTHTLETVISLEAAEKSGRAFLELEAMKQIAINLAKIVDLLSKEERHDR